MARNRVRGASAREVHGPFDRWRRYRAGIAASPRWRGKRLALRRISSRWTYPCNENARRARSPGSAMKFTPRRDERQVRARRCRTKVGDALVLRRRRCRRRRRRFGRGRGRFLFGIGGARKLGEILYVGTQAELRSDFGVPGDQLIFVAVLKPVQGIGGIQIEEGQVGVLHSDFAKTQTAAAKSHVVTFFPWIIFLCSAKNCDDFAIFDTHGGDHALDMRRRKQLSQI